MAQVWIPWPLCLMGWVVLGNREVWQLKERATGHLESFLEKVQLAGVQGLQHQLKPSEGPWL